MTIEVRLRPEAEQDLVEAASWYERQRDRLGQQLRPSAEISHVKIDSVQVPLSLWQSGGFSGQNRV